MEEHRKRVLDVCQRLSDKLDAAAVQLECERRRTIINITSADHTVLVWALRDYWDRVLNQKEATPMTTVDTHRLTLEEIKRMNCPIWVKCKPFEGGVGYWCLNNHGYIVTPGGNCFNAEEISSWEFYRRPPSTEEVECYDRANF